MDESIQVSLSSTLTGVGRPALIDRSGVLGAGLAIADEEGLESVTMQAVAERLGVTSMALYRHVADKNDLLDGLVERLLTDFPAPPAELLWADRLARVADAIRESAYRHPAVFPLLLHRPATTSGARAMRDGIFLALQEAGVGPEKIARTERLISTAILGFAASEVTGRFNRFPRHELDADFDLLKDRLRMFIDDEACG